ATPRRGIGSTRTPPRRSSPPSPPSSPATPDPAMQHPCNIASHLPRRAQEDPDGRAVVAWERGAWRHLTYAQLDAESDALARGLTAQGIGRGTRVVLMVPPSLEFFS